MGWWSKFWMLDFEFWFFGGEFALGRLVLDSFRIQNLKLPFGGHRRAATEGLDALRSLFIALFVTHRRGGFANECLFFKTRCSLRNRTRSRGCA